MSPDKDEDAEVAVVPSAYVVVVGFISGDGCQVRRTNRWASDRMQLGLCVSNVLRKRNRRYQKIMGLYSLYQIASRAAAFKFAVHSLLSCTFWHIVALVGGRAMSSMRVIIFVLWLSGIELTPCHDELKKQGLYL